MFIAGRVLDPQGKPVPNAAVMAYASGQVRLMAASSARRKAIGSGRFRLDAPRTSSRAMISLGAMALAPGYGAGWVELDPDAEQPAAEITLRPEQVIQGRLLRPARPARAGRHGLGLLRSAASFTAPRTSFAESIRRALLLGRNDTNDLPRLGRGQRSPTPGAGSPSMGSAVTCACR